MVLLEGNDLVHAVAGPSHCAVPGATARPKWRGYASDAFALPPAAGCIAQRGFDKHGAPTKEALSQAPGAVALGGGAASGPGRGGLDGGGWLACLGVAKSVLESEGKRGCRQLGLDRRDRQAGGDHRY